MKIATLLLTAAACFGQQYNQFVYVISARFDDIAAFQVGADGQLTQLEGSPYRTGTGPRSIVVDGYGQLLYSSNDDNTISGFLIDQADGTLRELQGFPIPAPVGVLKAIQGLVYLRTAEGQVYVFAPDGYGYLWPVPGESARMPGSVQPSNRFAFDRYADFAYAGEYGSSEGIASYFVKRTGNLAASCNTAVPGGYPIGHPTLPFLYARSQDLRILGYRIGSISGALTPIPTPSLLLRGTLRWVIEPQGRFLYLTIHTPTRIGVAFRIDPETGALTEVGTVNLSLSGLWTDWAGQYVYSHNAPDTCSYTRECFLNVSAIQPNGELRFLSSTRVGGVLDVATVSIAIPSEGQKPMRVSQLSHARGMAMANKR
jgi:DNA-binding beta-propeller fold protein YncE